MRTRARRLQWYKRVPCVLAVSLALGACGSSAGLGVGEVCHSSTQCAEGLLCDFQMNPPTCQDQGTPVPDAMIMIDADPNQIDAPPQIDATRPPDARIMIDAPRPPDASIDAPLPPIDAALPDA